MKNSMLKRSCGLMAAILALSLTAMADETISANVTLNADADWRDKGTVTIPAGVTVNLNGHSLKLTGLADGILVDLTSPGGNASTPSATWGEHVSGGTAGRVFNDQPSRAIGGRFAVSKVNGNFNMIVDYDFGEGNEQIVNMYKVYCEPSSSLRNRCPKSWVFYGSNDATTWTPLDSRTSETGWSTGVECRTKEFTNVTAYRHYRIEFTANNGDGDAMEIVQLEYFHALADLTSPGGNASTPSETWGDTGWPRGTADRVFDNQPTRAANGRFAVSKVNGKFNMIVDYDFGEGNEQIVNMYKVYCEPTASLRNRCPKSWVFYGSNDATTWTPLDSRTSETGWSTGAECRTKEFSNATAYRHYRIEFTANNGDVDALEIVQLEYFYYLGDPLVTSPLVDLTSPGGNASTSSPTWGEHVSGGTADRVFDNQPTRATGGRFAVSKVNGKFNMVVDYDFGEGNEQIVDIYKVYCEPSSSLRNRCPKSWVFYGSNDATTWTVLDTRMSETGWSTGAECRTKVFSNATAYRHYRIEFTGNNGDGDAMEIVQLEYFSTASAGKLILDIPEGATVDNQKVTIDGNVCLVKDGAGTFVASKANQPYLGGTQVSEGQLTVGNNTALGGESKVVIDSDGVLELNGKGALYKYSFVLNGGTLQNTVSDLGEDMAQIANLKLTADSTFKPTRSYGLVGSGYAATTLDLGGHTLTVPIGNDKKFYLFNTTVTAGTLNVSGGGSLVADRTSVNASAADLIANCALDIRVPFTVGSYESLYMGSNDAGAQPFAVQRVFKPHGSSYHGVTLADNAALDISECTTALNVVSTFANQQLTFAEGAMVTLDLGNRRVPNGTKVVAWDEKPAGLQQQQFKVKSNGRRYYAVFGDDGIYLEAGLVIYIR